MSSRQTIPAVVDAAASDFGSDEALVERGRSWTFSELAQDVDRWARALVASGVGPGDRVAIWGPNSASWAIASLAVHRCGGVLVTLNTRFKQSEAAHVLDRSGARLLFTVVDFMGTDHVEMLGERPDTVDEVIALEADLTEGTTATSDFLERAELVSPDSAAERASALTGDDASDLLFTSGTTGAPKAAILRHGASVEAFSTWSEVVGLRRGDRYLIVNPFFHTFGLKAGILACLLTGATMLPHAVFDAAGVMARIDNEQVTMLPGPPTVYQSILGHPDRGRYDLSSLRLAVTGAANVPVELVRAMRDELGFETVVTGYGLTEATGVVTMCRHDDDPETIATTCGRAIPGVEVAVVDDDGGHLPAGEAGEVVVRGKYLMAGYFGDPKATAEAIYRDGWLHTGDIGVLDERGYLRITDRKKDMFIVGGFNAYPAEIENSMLSHRSVAQVAVIGVHDDRLGEVGKAFVVARAGTTIDPDELMAWCRERMANYKVPRYVEIVDALPLNASGKVVKDELRTR